MKKFITVQLVKLYTWKYTNAEVFSCAVQKDTWAW